MTIDVKIRDRKLWYDINREAAKSASNISIIIWKIDKYKYLTGEVIIPPNQRRVIEQAKFAYSPLGKPFEKQKQLNSKAKIK